MKTIQEVSYLLANRLLIPRSLDQNTTQHRFQSDDVILIDSACDEQQWLEIALACMQLGTRLLAYPANKSAQQLALRIQEEKITVLYTTARRWLSIYQELNHKGMPVTRLTVVLIDTNRRLERRSVWLPAVLSRAKIKDTYEAYSKAPWLATKTSK